MKDKDVLIVFAILAAAVLFASCGGAAGVDMTPKPVSGIVTYERVLILYPEGMDAASITYEYTQNGFVHVGERMEKVAENQFSTNVALYTNTLIYLWIRDPRTYDGGSNEPRTRIFFKGEEFIVNQTRGVLKFTIDNDGTIRVINP